MYKSSQVKYKSQDKDDDLQGMSILPTVFILHALTLICNVSSGKTYIFVSRLNTVWTGHFFTVFCIYYLFLYYLLSTRMLGVINYFMSGQARPGPSASEPGPARLN